MVGGVTVGRRGRVRHCGRAPTARGAGVSPSAFGPPVAARRRALGRRTLERVDPLRPSSVARTRPDATASAGRRGRSALGQEAQARPPRDTRHALAPLFSLYPSGCKPFPSERRPYPSSATCLGRHGDTSRAGHQTLNVLLR